MGCEATCSKIFLFVVNVAVWLVGAAFLAVGIWVAVSPSTFVQQALNVIDVTITANDNQGAEAKALANEVLSNTSLLMIGAYVMIAVGGLLFLVGFCGCCGACKDSKCLLVIYVIFCSLAFAITLAAGVVEAVYLNRIDHYLTMAFINLQNTFFDAMWDSSSPLSQFWFNVMQATECCGIYGTSDFTSSNSSFMANAWLSSNRETCAGNQQCFSNATVPVSCCQLTSVNGTYMVSNSACPQIGLGAFNASCSSTFISPFASQLHTYASIVMGVTFGLAAFCILAVAAAATLIHRLNKESSKNAKYV